MLAAWIMLAVMDVALKLLGFPRFYRLVSSWPKVGALPADRRAERAREIAEAMDRARMYYFKHAWCLQRAAATVCFLRSRGIPAEMVVGVRKFPFYAHAWTEVGEGVVGDSPSVRTRYREITRC